MSNQQQIYQTLISVGAKPHEAQMLSAIAMAESGGQMIPSRVDPNSHGWYQINMDAHSGVNPYDPVDASRYALQLFREQGGRPWSVTHTGAHQQYLGGGAMPNGHNTDIQQWIAQHMPGFGDGGGGYPGGYVEIYPGVIAIINPETGMPYANTIRNAPDRSSQMPISGNLIPTGIPGLYVNPNTGAMVDTRTDGGQQMQPPITGLKQMGRGMLGAETPFGVQSLMGDPYYSNPRTMGIRGVAPGYFGLEDESGRVFDFLPNQDYISPWNKMQFGEGQRQFDVSAGLSGGLPLWQFEEGNKRWQQEMGRARGLDREDARRFGLQFGEGQRQFDTSIAEDSRRFDASLAETIAARQQRIQELQMELASADARHAREIQAQIQMHTERLQTELQIAGITDARERFVAGLQAGVAQRGQDIGYMAETRGQDIGRELGLRNLTKGYLDSAIEISGRDPLRGAAYLLGDKGGTTPIEGALATFRDAIAPQIKPVGDAPALPARIPVTGAASGKKLVLEPDEVVTVGEGERGEGFRAGTAELIKPTGRPNEFKVMPMRGRNTFEDPETKEHYQLDRAPGMQTGGTVSAQQSTPSTALHGWRRVGANLYAGPQGQKVSKAHYDGLVRRQQRAAQAGSQPRRLTPMQKFQQTRDRLMQIRNDRVARQEAEEARNQPTEATGTGGAASGIPVSGSQTGGLAQIEETVRNLLQKAFYGEMPSEGGADILSGRPLFGVDLPDPKKMAARWSSGQLPANLRQTMLSAWGMRDMDAAEVGRRIQAVTPRTIPLTAVGYG